MNSALNDNDVTINLIINNEVLTMYSSLNPEVLIFSIYSELLTIKSVMIGGEMMIRSKAKGRP